MRNSSKTGSKFRSTIQLEYDFLVSALLKSITLDSIDLAILDELQKDSDGTNLHLSRRVHVSPPTCLRRVRRLRESGLIERHIAVLNGELLAPVLGHGLEAVVEV